MIASTLRSFSRQACAHSSLASQVHWPGWGSFAGQPISRRIHFTPSRLWAGPAAGTPLDIELKTMGESVRGPAAGG